MTLQWVHLISRRLPGRRACSSTFCSRREQRMQRISCQWTLPVAAADGWGAITITFRDHEVVIQKSEGRNLPPTLIKVKDKVVLFGAIAILTGLMYVRFDTSILCRSRRMSTTRRLGRRQNGRV